MYLTHRAALMRTAPLSANAVQPSDCNGQLVRRLFKGRLCMQCRTCGTKVWVDRDGAVTQTAKEVVTTDANELVRGS